MPLIAPHNLPTRDDIAAMVRLAVPVVVVQVGMMLMGVVDTMMVGWHSSASLASVGLANQYLWGVTVFLFGVLVSLEPVVSQAVGAGDTEAVARGTQRGLVLSVAAALVTALALLPAATVMRSLGQPEEIIPAATEYLYITIPGMLPFYAFVVLRITLQAMHRVAPIVWAIVLSNIANAALDYAMIFGKFGLPAMGVEGSAWATTICRLLMCVLMVVCAWKESRPLLWPVRHGVLHRAPLRRLVRLGTPIGVHMWLEFAAFAAVAFLMGTLGMQQLAAHHVALNLASLTFMVPLGVAQAAGVLVGNSIGAEDIGRARRAALTAILTGAAFMCFTAAMFLLIPQPLAALYTDDAVVLAIAASLLPIAGVFQVFDGLQAVGAGVLRGTADTRAPMIIGITGFWLVGLPASIIMAFTLDLGPRGLWWGFVVGLFVVSTLLMLRVRQRLSGDLARVIIDEHHAAHHVPPRPAPVASEDVTGSPGL